MSEFGVLPLSTSVLVGAEVPLRANSANTTRHRKTTTADAIAMSKGSAQVGAYEERVNCDQSGGAIGTEAIRAACSSHMCSIRVIYVTRALTKKNGWVVFELEMFRTTDISHVAPDDDVCDSRR